MLLNFSVPTYSSQRRATSGLVRRQKYRWKRGNFFCIKFGFPCLDVLWEIFIFNGIYRWFWTRKIAQHRRPCFLGRYLFIHLKCCCYASMSWYANSTNLELFQTPNGSITAPKHGILLNLVVHFNLFSTSSVIYIGCRYSQLHVSWASSRYTLWIQIWYMVTR